MKDRLKAIRKHHKINQEEYANSIGLTRNFISLLETGERIPSDRTIKDICRVYNVNETWLRTGDGEMFGPTTREQELATIAADLFKEDDTSFKTRLIKCISKLNEDEILLLEKITNDLAGNNDKEV